MGFGEIAAWMPGMKDPVAEIKEVVFRPSTAADTIKVGDIVCFNTDVSTDVEEKSSNPSSLGSTYAEGSQNYTGRLLLVEKPASGNTHAPAVVAQLGPLAGADGDRIQVYILNGAVIPVYVNANCTLDETVIGALADSYTGAAVRLDGSNYVQGDGDPLAIGVAAETVDRSTDNGLVWVRTFREPGIGRSGVYVAPVRAVATPGYAYGVYIEGTKLLRGTAASKGYVLNVTGDREASYVATGDSNDALIKAGGSNYAACDSNFIFRALNVSVANRSGGTLSLLTNNISVSTKSGSTTTTAIGLQVDCQHQSASTPTELGGLDVSLNYEGGHGTLEYGIRVRTRGTINVKVDHALYFSKGTDYGFTNFIGVDAAATLSIVAAGITTKTWDANDIAIPIKVGSTTYYLFASDSNS